VVMAEVGLAEAALVGLAAFEVAVAGLAAAEAKRQLVLHRKSGSFIRRLVPDITVLLKVYFLLFVRPITFICLCLLFLFLFTTHNCPTFFVI
jgi:hypothetical protein